MEKATYTRRHVLQVLGAGALAAVTPAIARAAGAPLTLGIQTSTWGAVGMVAEAEKLFEKAGANVVVQKFDSGRAVRDAMVAGRIDLGSLGAAPFVLGAGKGDLAALGTVAYAGGTLAVVAGRKSGVKSVGDLKGKKVASQIGSETDHVFQTKIAPHYGLKHGDFQVINVKFHDHISALASGSVDAFAGVEPYPALAEVDGIGTKLTDYTKFDIVPLMLAVNRPVLEKRSAELIPFLKGWLAAVRMFKENPKRVAQIVQNFYASQGYKVSEQVIARALAPMSVDPNYVPELKAYLTAIADTLMKKGQMTAMPDWDRVLDRQILQRANA
jgi:ABC-type nitrate/sulfonate/bicarbonate transport system substrate-binding protein